MQRPKTFDELKAYFEKTILPKEMANCHMYFKDVKKAVDININRIELEIERLGRQGVKRSITASAAKTRLIEIVEVLENKENHFVW